MVRKCKSKAMPNGHRLTTISLVCLFILFVVIDERRKITAMKNVTAIASDIVNDNENDAVLPFVLFFSL